MDYDKVLEALLATDNPPCNYGLTATDVRRLAECFDWDTQVTEHNWSTRGGEHATLADMIRAEPAAFLADISRYYGDDYYL